MLSAMETSGVISIDQVIGLGPGKATVRIYQPQKIE